MPKFYHRRSLGTSANWWSGRANFCFREALFFQCPPGGRFILSCNLPWGASSGWGSRGSPVDHTARPKRPGGTAGSTVTISHNYNAVDVVTWAAYPANACKCHLHLNRVGAFWRLNPATKTDFKDGAQRSLWSPSPRFFRKEPFAAEIILWFSDRKSSCNKNMDEQQHIYIYIYYRLLINTYIKYSNMISIL